MANNLNESDILEALEEPILDSGSEGEVDDVDNDPEFISSGKTLFVCSYEANLFSCFYYHL